MAPAARGLLDTSVFIAVESARPIDASLLPDHSVVCPVTIAELQAGVLAGADLDVRARRLATLESIADVEVLAIDAGTTSGSRRPPWPTVFPSSPKTTTSILSTGSRGSR